MPDIRHIKEQRKYEQKQAQVRERCHVHTHGMRESHLLAGFHQLVELLGPARPRPRSGPGPGPGLSRLATPEPHGQLAQVLLGRCA